MPINDVSFKVHAGEVLGLVGKSGCGKSMTALSIMRLLPKAGRITSGEIRFHDEDLAQASEARMRSVRGNAIGMVFQDPMTSLNPVMTVGKQLMESILWHTEMGKKAALSRSKDLLHLVGIPTSIADRNLSPSAIRRHAAAGDDRHGARVRA